jgi:hypothetical protein
MSVQIVTLALTLLVLLAPEDPKANAHAGGTPESDTIDARTALLQFWRQVWQDESEYRPPAIQCKSVEEALNGKRWDVPPEWLTINCTVDARLTAAARVPVRKLDRLKFNVSGSLDMNSIQYIGTDITLMINPELVRSCAIERLCRVVERTGVSPRVAGEVERRIQSTPEIQILRDARIAPPEAPADDSLALSELLYHAAIARFAGQASYVGQIREISHCDRNVFLRLPDELNWEKPRQPIEILVFDEAGDVAYEILILASTRAAAEAYHDPPSEDIIRRFLTQEEIETILWSCVTSGLHIAESTQQPPGSDSESR